jgi:hypothetical protein
MRVDWLKRGGWCNRLADVSRFIQSRAAGINVRRSCKAPIVLKRHARIRATRVTQQLISPLLDVLIFDIRDGWVEHECALRVIYRAAQRTSADLPFGHQPGRRCPFPLVRYETPSFLGSRIF